MLSMDSSKQGFCVVQWWQRLGTGWGYRPGLSEYDESCCEMYHSLSCPWTERYARFCSKTDCFSSLGQVCTHLSSVAVDCRRMRMTRLVQHDKRGQSLTRVTIFGADLGMLSRLISSMILALEIRCTA